LPRPLKGRTGCDFSFSGLKTAVRQMAEQIPADDATALADLAASVEAAICDTIIDRTGNAVRWFRRHYPTEATLVAAGGVAANTKLRARLAALADGFGLSFVAPSPSLCTDNGAMVAWAGLERLRLGLVDGLDAPVWPRWPLGETTQNTAR
jgi:N6-L-threonylcarbamoyladenine synthase